MNMTIKMVMAAVIAAGAAGCAHYAGSADTRVSSLRGADVPAADAAPADFKIYRGKRPGLDALIERTFQTQPPLIPHAIDNFDEITLESNQCLECHSPATAKAKNSPPVRETHLVAGKATINDWRYQCNTCHVPQVDAQPLVGNRFVGEPYKRQVP